MNTGASRKGGSTHWPSSDALDDVTARYETMPIEDVRAELRAAGIDPAPTIAAVRQLIEARITGEPLPNASSEDRKSSRVAW